MAPDSQFGGGEGGGVFCDQSFPLIVHSTLLQNHAYVYGGGVFSGNYSHPEIINSVLWSDTTLGDGPEICVLDYSEMTVSYCDVKGGEQGAYVGNFSSLYWLDGNIDLDPDFLPLADYGHLSADSPCIDKIEISLLEFDIDGDARPFDHPGTIGCCYDMGADEFVGE